MSEKTPERHLDCKEIKPVNPKGNQSCIFTGRTDAEAESSNTLTTWYEELIHWKKTQMLVYKQEEKGTTEDEMIEWHHLLNGHEFEHTLGVGDG